MGTQAGRACDALIYYRLENHGAARAQSTPRFWDNEHEFQKIEQSTLAVAL
jgi:hypothetical protein